MVARALHLNWHNPVHLTFGAGCFADIASASPVNSVDPSDKAVVVLADRAALRADDEVLLRAALGDGCKAWAWFEGGLATVALARALCAQLWPVMHQHRNARVFAVGGGTTLDLAKVLRWRHLTDNNQCTTDTVAHWRANTLAADFQRHALWLAPTTSGTGSEVTRWATLWDTDAAIHTKLSWAPADGFAERALVDPLLTLSCPSRITRDCALDTLAHALESLWNRQSNAATRALAVQAAQRVLQALPQALLDPADVAARTALSHASVLAGLAMSQTQTALAHALSYDLTLHEGMPHGEACAVWLPMAWELALGADPACDAALAQLFNTTAAAGLQSLRHWLYALGVSPRDLRGDASGIATLTTEMQSARGRNFIAKPSGKH